MPRSLSVYLDLLRTVAAFAVFLNHAKTFLGLDIPFLSAQGSNAVAAFFVLSGLVIAYVTDARETTAARYGLARAARLYSVVLIALAVTFVADTVGNMVDPAYYAHLATELHVYHAPTWGAALASVSFTHQLWFTHTVFGSNEPFWSLGFEAWYYVLFGFVVFAPSMAIRLLSGGLWALIVGPKIVLYLPVWLIGVAARAIVARSRWTIPADRARVCLILSLIPFEAVSLAFNHAVGSMAISYDPAFEAFNFAYYTAIGLAIALNIVVFSAAYGHATVFGPVAERRIRWLAGGSFTLYLVHQPLLILTAALIPAARINLPAGILGGAAVLVAAYLLAEVGERRKAVFARALQAITTRIAPRKG